MNTAVLLAALVCAAVTLGIGDFALSPARVIDALLGSGSRAARLAVVDWRLPAAIASLAFGVLLGVAGAIFQSLTRNPLGSPDVVGFDSGSHTAVVVLLLFFGVNGYWSLALAAVVGGLVTAALVYALSASRGGPWGFRLIIVGIAISALLGSVNAYLVSRADKNQLLSVGFWSAGSLTRMDWSKLAVTLCLGAILLVAVVACAPVLQQLELGDDAARAHGVGVRQRLRLLMALGVACSAIVTAAAGPIAFIALAAPQIGARLTRSQGVSIASAACTGALLLASAQLLSVLLGVLLRPIPIGLVTVCGGGLYLIALLIREQRRNP